MDAVEEIKERLDAVTLIGETVKLRKSGKNYVGFCPFHPNTRTPAFVVFPESNTWRCFGACNEGGDIFTFVMKKEGLDFPEALRLLAQRAGVELAPRGPEARQEEEQYERLRAALEAAVTFYRHQLLHNPAGEPVLAYLRGRGLRDETLERFEVGYAPNAWDATYRFLLGKGFEMEELVQAGLVSERESGGYFDRFRHRIMIPIRDARGRMAGFGARVVDPEDVPKFLNSPQTPLFDKGRLLYGLDKARKAIRSADQAVIVEGYMDVMALHQAGFENVVSPMGTALTEAQLRLLKRYSRRLVLALDADVAGDRATLRGLTVARETLDREQEPVFDARGLVRYEGRLDAEIRIATLPAGMDPDELVAADPQAWADLLAGAQTVVAYVLDVLTREKDLSDPKVKAEIARQVVPLIEDVADPVEREAYRQMLARRIGVDERALLTPARAARPRRRRAPAEPPPVAVEAVQRAGRLERFCLGALLARPEILYRVDRELQALEMPRLNAEDFAGEEGRLVLRAVHQALDQEEQEPAEACRAALEDVLPGPAEGYLTEVADLTLEEPRVEEGVVNAFLRLRRRSLDRQLSGLQFQLAVAQEEDPDRVLVLQRQAMDLARARDRLDRALAGRSRALQVDLI